jgi:hypothetical protein
MARSIQETIVYLKDRGLLKSSMRCLFCQEPMQWKVYTKNMDGYVWKCFNKACLNVKTTRSIRSESFFDILRINLRKALGVIHSCSKEDKVEDVAEMYGLSRNTVMTVNYFLRLICKKYFVLNPIILGWEGIICQVDESMFAYKPKGHRGRAPENKRWVLA